MAMDTAWQAAFHFKNLKLLVLKGDEDFNKRVANVVQVLLEHNVDRHANTHSRLRKSTTKLRSTALLIIHNSIANKSPRKFCMGGSRQVLRAKKTKAKERRMSSQHHDQKEKRTKKRFTLHAFSGPN